MNSNKVLYLDFTKRFGKYPNVNRGDIPHVSLNLCTETDDLKKFHEWLSSIVSKQENSEYNHVIYHYQTEGDMQELTFDLKYSAKNNELVAKIRQLKSTKYRFILSYHELIILHDYISKILKDLDDPNIANDYLINDEQLLFKYTKIVVYYDSGDE